MTYGKMIRLSLFIALLVTAVAIFLLSGNHQWVEKSYSNTLFPGIASFLRFLLGSLPFSLGDFLYMAAGIYVLWELFLFFKILLNRNASWKERFVPFQKAGLMLLFIYVYFYLFWGLNYYRLGIEHQLGLKNGAFVKEELIALNKELLNKVNETKIICLQRNDTVIARQRMFTEAVTAYQNLEKLLPFIRYRNTSLKSSFFGRAGNYIGFQGYYNPFTGEAQVNTRIPNFLQPYVTCHEMAHQIGYASESEANFVGFLAATHSADTLMQYSSYFDMFLYAMGNLSAVDSTAAKAIAKELHEGVKRDLRTYREFAKKHRTFIQGWTDVLYDYYLRRNRQRKGIESYNEVTGWLIAYKKKNGSL